MRYAWCIRGPDKSAVRVSSPLQAMPHCPTGRLNVTIGKPFSHRPAINRKYRLDSSRANGREPISSIGAMEEDAIENNCPATFRTRETADLFLVLIKHLLKDSGRATVVLRDGTLFGEDIETRIKEQLLAACNRHTAVRLPNRVFKPCTGIRTNLLLVTKGSPTQDVWFYEHP